jgi:hypothetical protein
MYFHILDNTILIIKATANNDFEFSLGTPFKFMDFTLKQDTNWLVSTFVDCNSCDNSYYFPLNSKTSLDLN